MRDHEVDERKLACARRRRLREPHLTDAEAQDSQAPRPLELHGVQIAGLPACIALLRDLPPRDRCALNASPGPARSCKTRARL